MSKKPKPDSNLIWIVILLVVALITLFYLQQQNQQENQENFIGESHYGPRACTNECLSGGRKCVGRLGYKYCASFYDADTCTEWSPTKRCRSGQICLGQEPTARCGPIPKSAYT